MPKKKKIEEYELKEWKCDDMHFDFKTIDGYQKSFNFVVCSREAGKSVALWKKIYNNFRRTGHPAVIFRRKIVDITCAYIDDIATLINKFTHNNIEFNYAKGDIKQGQIDVRLNDKIFFRVIALSAPMSRLKSMVLRNVDIMGFDEFICNMRAGEKYETEESFKFEEVFTTYNRESEKGIKCYFCGNPYSMFNPYFSWLGISAVKLGPGKRVSGPTYIVDCYKVKPELASYLKMHNPLYTADADYAAYAFDGNAIQDTYIRILKTQPIGFKLTTLFKIQNKIIGVFRRTTIENYDKIESIDCNPLRYWVRKMKPEELSVKRDILTFDFGQMADHTILINIDEKRNLNGLKQAIQYREIAYADIEVSYFMEEIYACI